MNSIIYPRALNVQQHPFHLVNPSPWPLFVSLGLFQIVLDFVFAINSEAISFSWDLSMWDWVVLANSFLFLVYILHSWFSNIVEEAFFNGHHTKKVEISLKLGMGLFIVSEVMFFFSIFWAFFHSSVSPAISIGAVWPPVGIEPISAFGVPFLNTVILLFSGLTLTLSHRMFVLIAGHSTPSIPAVKTSLEEQEARSHSHAWFFDYESFAESELALINTILLGGCFTVFQLAEYNSLGYNFSDSVYGSCFYMATGFHGIHVMLGVIFLLAAVVRLIDGTTKADRHFGYLSAIWYWHFVDVVWLFLFLIVYYWGGRYSSDLPMSVQGNTIIL